MSLKRETRKDWGAPPDKGKRWVSAATAKTGGVAVHYPGASGSLRRLSHHQCQSLLRQWAAMHMNRGSMFLEYGSLICHHGIWMEARTTFDGGWLARVGSNGTTAANDNYTSVQLMLGTDDTITENEKEWLAESIATLRDHGWGSQVRPHSHFYSTACPGPSIRNALPEISRMADRWKETGVAISDKDVERIADATAARVNRVLGDYNSKGEPAGPNKDNPQFGATYIRQIKGISKKVLGEVKE
jgi:hypothetical protein